MQPKNTAGQNTGTRTSHGQQQAFGRETGIRAPETAWQNNRTHHALHSSSFTIETLWTGGEQLKGYTMPLQAWLSFGFYAFMFFVVWRLAGGRFTRR